MKFPFHIDIVNNEDNLREISNNYFGNIQLKYLATAPACE